MLMRSFLVVVIATLGMVNVAAAAKPLQAKPWVYDPDNLGICEAEWVNKQGLPDAGSNFALLLTKMGATAENTASGASLSFSGSSITELGFDYRNDGHCGAGAPRFNVYTDTDVYYFFGCDSGTHTPINADWTRVRFTAASAFPSDGQSFITDFSDITVTGIEIVFDEGTDQGQGFVYLDNIDVNGTLIGKPGASK